MPGSHASSNLRSQDISFYWDLSGFENVWILSINNALKICFVVGSLQILVTCSTAIWISEVTIKDCPPPPQLHSGYYTEVSGSDGRIKYVEYFCNNAYILSGDSKRTCQKNGTWSGSQPLCVRGNISTSSCKAIMKYLLQTHCQLEHLNCFTACREPKVSKLVRQKVLKYQPPSR